MHSRVIGTATAIVLAAATAPAAQTRPAAAPSDAQGHKQRALTILEGSKDALLRTEFVLSVKLSRGGQEAAPREQKIKLDATVVDPSGLAVVSNASTDVASLLAGRLRGVKVSSSIVDVKFIRNDGTDLPAEIVFKDPDLDLLFLRPKEAEGTYPYVKLDPASSPGMLDPVIAVGRMDMSANRTPVVAVLEVRGIIQKPQTYYVAQGLSVGLPAFDARGRCFGLYLRRIRGGKPVGSAVILPAADILDVVDQLKPDEQEE